MSNDLLLAILSTLGIGGVLATLVKGLISWISGSAGRERQRNTDLESQRAAAVLERDHERKRADAERTKTSAALGLKRKTQEYASQLRRQLFEAGITPLPWPVELVDDPATPTPEGNTA
ncbi:hypothetical protein C5B94_04035 [Clavibacter michiganensis]|uniref:hypothetical protein n=1 Tax=Clavibacter michiganensis TaxID=28447 RepID=UPI000CE773AD|nr:hypothetical protein [Clavibacter michiganensis]PPF56099.1 hypothetical protein C5B94_04035 [Clavibacter michiganensis]